MQAVEEQNVGETEIAADATIDPLVMYRTTVRRPHLHARLANVQVEFLLLPSG
jgi:hypothetical protein